MKIDRRGALLGLAAPALLRGGIASADELWLARPIRFIVPFTPGGPTDAVARLVTQRLNERLRANLVVENVGGAGGGLGMERLTRAAPDGSAIGLGTTGTHGINPHLYARLPYDPVRGFTPVSLLIEHINMLVLRGDHPARNLSDLLAAARRGTVTYGSAGNGSSNHLSAELLCMKAGVQMQHVPFRGSGPSMAEVLAGRIDFMFDTPAALPLVQGTNARIIAVTSTGRHPLLPEVPAIAETIPDYKVIGWFGVFGPAGLPAPIVTTLNQAIAAVLAEPETQARLRGMGLDPASSSPEELAARVTQDDALWGSVIRQAGLQAG
jgi:tripartite-type tricarboxylate transporter receptor subunit TctC